MCKNARGHAALGQFVVTARARHGWIRSAPTVMPRASRRGPAPQRHRSEMMRALDRLLRFISIAIIPVFVIMFAKQYFFLHTAEVRMSSTVAAIIGMIPEGFTFW